MRLEVRSATGKRPSINMRIEPEISGCSIVLVGDFNPVIFQPAWLAAHDIDGSGEAVSVQIIHRDICQFTIETRNYFVEKDRLIVETMSAPWVLISDIVGRIFLEFLSHTPVRAFGINRDVHFTLPSPEHRVDLGRRLAPLPPWGTFGKSMHSDDPEMVGGLQRLNMRSKSRIEGAKVETNAIVEPSLRLNTDAAVYMRINSHHEISNLADGHGATEAVGLMTKRFETVIDESDAIVDQMMKEGLKQ